ncbi:MAG: hydroxysqualene dehydroxylase HpnE [Pseudomonadota bacterium]
MACVKIIGAGLSGLAAAVALIGKGHHVTLFEASAQAGGRCRSYHDAQLGCEIDNGNHLLLTANQAAMAYMKTLGTRDSLIGPDRAVFPFLDLQSGERWQVAPNSGPIPWWVLSKNRRIPGTMPSDYMEALRLAKASPSDKVGDCVKTYGPLWSRFWEPLTVAALNTRAEDASARLLWRVLKDSFLRGQAHCRPLIARDSLGQSLVQPALDLILRQGCEIHFNQRLKGLGFEGSNVNSLAFQTNQLTVEATDRVVLALPPWIAGAMVPDLKTPNSNHAIVNAHIRLPHEMVARAQKMLPAAFIGLIGGTADWLFLRRDLVSLTVSAADTLAEEPNDRILEKLWRDTAQCLGLDLEPTPKMRLIKEKRATFSQTPESLDGRPPAATRWRNLFLAGDWTDTGYPATIESAIRSGNRAASLIASGSFPP